MKQLSLIKFQRIQRPQVRFHSLARWRIFSYFLDEVATISLSLLTSFRCEVPEERCIAARFFKKQNKKRVEAGEERKKEKKKKKNTREITNARSARCKITVARWDLARHVLVDGCRGKGGRKGKGGGGEMIKMPKLARECLAGNGVHRSGVKMPAMHLHTAGLGSRARAVGGGRLTRAAWTAQVHTHIPKALRAREEGSPGCDFAHRK